MSRTVRITHLDGKLPNLALMRISAFHRAAGDEVIFSRDPVRHLDEPDYDVVYASAIFSKTAPSVAELRRWWPDAVVGGTWEDRRGEKGEDLNPKVEDHVPSRFVGLDYSIYPDFKASLGFTQRGCRFRCGFCVVPTKEGRPNTFSPIHSIWRGPGNPKTLHILDNDFFGSPEWSDRLDEVRDGGFRICLNQGINLRIISDRQAAALATVEYRNDAFSRRMIYTAWDNPADQRVFFRGVERLRDHGIPPSHLMAYNLVGFFPDETWDSIWDRHHRQVEQGIKPYVMLHEDAKARDEDGAAPTWRALKRYQRWVNMGLYRLVPWAEYDVNFKTSRRRPDGRQIELI